ncbi:MAG: hypothetical protein HY264_00335, partial [Chloroflexi bacterium]|nr:hypothetical protein [Chloroflexota bacterium]
MNERPSRAARAAVTSRRLMRPIGGRAPVVIAAVVALAIVAGGAVLLQVTNQMRREADGRLNIHVAGQAAILHDAIDRASRDVRLARQNVVFEDALARTDGPLLPADRAAVEAAITYLGDRYEVDEICLIRTSGLEAAR